jgi:O-antigen ligase
MLLILLVSAVFVGFYAPLLGVRFGVQETQQATFEEYSAASRAVYQEQAVTLIKRHPWVGVGIGNMAWHSAAMLQFDPRDLRGQPVHNIYLLAWSEVGVIGFALFMGAVFYGIGLTLWRAWGGRLHPYQIGLLGAVLGLLVVGWFDHYLWTQYGHLLIFWGSFAVMLSPVEEDA